MVFVLLGVSGDLAGVLKASAAAFGDSPLGEVLVSKMYSSTKGASWLFSKPPSLLKLAS